MVGVRAGRILGRGGEVKGGKGDDNVLDVGGGGRVLDDGVVDGLKELGLEDGGHARACEVCGVVVEVELLVVAEGEDVV